MLKEKSLDHLNDELQGYLKDLREMRDTYHKNHNERIKRMNETINEANETIDETMKALDAINDTLDEINNEADQFLKSL